MRSCLVLTMICLASFGNTGANAADMLQLVVEGNGDGLPESLPDASAAAIKKMFFLSEGDSYEFVPPGAAKPANRRNLRTTATTVAQPEQQQQHRSLDLGCPNACSNSGSTRCWSLGCSYCGRCDGRRLMLSEQRQIEAAINAFLSDICADASDCALEAKILRVSDDGSVSRAT
jgi:hypothetical protein